MKYLKSYEDENMALPKYDNDDYVILKRVENNVGQILECDNDNKYYWYNVQFISLDFTEIKNIWFSEKNLERKATPEEIEIYKIKKTQLKYNL